MTYLPNKAPLMFGAKELGWYVPIQIETGGLTHTWATFIGRGRFTTAFKAGRYVYLYTFHDDFSKSILAHTYRQYEENPHLPKIERVGRMKYKGQTCNVYKAWGYKQIDEGTKLTRANQEVIKTLQELHEAACAEFKGDIVRTYQSSEFNQFITQGDGMFRLPYLIRAALEALAETALDWGDHYIFDSFKLRNLALNGKGQLILIDPLFDFDKIMKDHKVRSRREKQQARAVHAIDNDFS